MATIAGDGLSSPAIEQDPSIAQIQAAQLAAQAAIAVALPASGFVASIDGLTGLITFASGTHISVTNDGVSNFTFSTTGLGTIVTHNQAAAVADLNQTISNPPTQAEVQAISTKVDELLDSLRTAGILAP